MAEVKIYGSPLSSYMRTARMACVEKGVAYDLVEMAPGATVDGVSHPFGKIPVMVHGGFRLYETQAIARHIERSFGGPALIPADARAQALMDQWISATCDYLYQSCVRELVLPRLVVPMRGGQTDEAAIQRSLPRIVRHLEVVDEALGRSPYLAGEAVSLADLFLAPIMFWTWFTPEGRQALEPRRNIGKWWERMAARASVKDTMPPMPKERAA
jgi:glutathione S-transferase